MRETMQTLRHRIESLEHDGAERLRLYWALAAVLEKRTERLGVVTHDDFRYTVSCFDLEGAQGGFLLVAGHYIRGTQRDSYDVYTIDELAASAHGLDGFACAVSECTQRAMRMRYALLHPEPVAAAGAALEGGR